LFLFGEKRLTPKMHWLSAVLVWIGSWLSGYFIIVTDAWMQHPVGHRIENGQIILDSIWALLLNPWALWQYLHNMLGAVLTACFVMASIGAFYLLQQKHIEHAQMFIRTGVIAGFIGSILIIVPTGDEQGRNVALYQPTTLAAMEGLFETKEGAPMVLIGQPDMERMRLDNPLEVPYVLSFLTYKRWGAEVRGLDSFPREEWPDNIPLLYYAYHIMVGLGTIFSGVMALSAFLLWRGKLFATRPMLWVLMLMLPLPYIANTAGWMTAELGRQPWLIHGLMRTADGASANVATGSAMFTLLGFMGMYALLSVLFLFLVTREIAHGPEAI
jgi:cytochrome bd ubiquinol oxidase subunit I